MKELIEIQKELKVSKAQRNTFGNYNYRSCEDILEAVKPLCTKSGCLLTISDEMVMLGDRYYIKATAQIVCPNGSHSVTAYAREAETKKGMDASQITGSASSYARKYALNGLFCIDDTKDADTMDNSQKAQNKAPNKNLMESTKEQIKLLEKCVIMLTTNGLPDKAKTLESMINDKMTVASFDSLYNTACTYLGKKVEL